jgi:DNA-binding response OmpR family regulator
VLVNDDDGGYNALVQNHEATTTNHQTTSRGHILYAEDEESSRVSLSELLRKEGYTCDTAPDGVVAASMLRESRFDCLIADIKMLGNSELELIRNLPTTHAGLPVILVTGYPSVETAVESLKHPVLSYLVKPIDFDALLASVREAVFRRALVRQFEMTCAHLDQWRADMEQLTDGLKNSTRMTAANPMNVYLMITYRNILDALMGLKTVMEQSLSMSPVTKSAEPHGVAPLLLIEALRDTIAVLEKTKDAFHSRELGELRHRLENLLLISKEKQANGAI